MIQEIYKIIKICYRLENVAPLQLLIFIDGNRRQIAQCNECFSYLCVTQKAFQELLLHLPVRQKALQLPMLLNFFSISFSHCFWTNRTMVFPYVCRLFLRMHETSNGLISLDKMENVCEENVLRASNFLCLSIKCHVLLR